MATQFQVDTERIHVAAVDITRIGADIEAQVGAMMGRLIGLQDAWTGSASMRFQGVVADWQATQRQVKSSLDAIGQTLSAAGTQYADVEASAERMFS